jgi:ribonuclease VapC
MTAVLDASAILAVIFAEPGEARVRRAMASGALLSTVDLSEVVARLARSGRSRDDIADVRTALLAGVALVDVDEALAIEAGLAIGVTRDHGLSLGDRICLMLAKSRGVVALTADAGMAAVADALGVKVELIR